MYTPDHGRPSVHDQVIVFPYNERILRFDSSAYHPELTDNRLTRAEIDAFLDTVGFIMSKKSTRSVSKTERKYMIALMMGACFLVTLLAAGALISGVTSSTTMLYGFLWALGIMVVLTVFLGVFLWVRYQDREKGRDARPE
jgi:hypothetical protein